MREKRQLKHHQEEKLQKEAASVLPSVEKPIKDKTPPSGSPETSGSAHHFVKKTLVKPLEDGVESPGKEAAISPGKQAAPLQERKAKSRC